MRAYIDHLRQAGALRAVSREVDPRYELAAVVRAAQAAGEDALLFRNVAGTELPVASNLYGSHRRLCELIGAPDDNFCAQWLKLSEAAPVSPPTAPDPSPDALEIAFGDLPRITWHEKDAGAYITSGIVLARHPETGVANLSFHRAMYVSDAELRIRIGPSHDLAGYMAAMEAQGQALEIAMLVGPSPEIFLAACASPPPEADELDIAAAMRGAPVPMRPSATINVDVPSATEVVVEGRILPGERRPEAPFGEFMGYYVPEGMNHVFEVTGVTARADPIWHGLLCGSPEDMRPLEAAIAARIFAHLVRAQIPGVLDVSTRPQLLNTVVRIDKQSDAHPRQVMEAAWDAHADYSKACVVVDRDVDIHDMDRVWWSFLTRGRADRRTHIVEDRSGFYRDPHGDHRGRIGIDATMPLDRRAEFDLKTIPGADRIDLADYLD